MSGGNLRLLERCKERLRELQRIIASRDEVDSETFAGGGGVTHKYGQWNGYYKCLRRESSYYDYLWCLEWLLYSFAVFRARLQVLKAVELVLQTFKVVEQA